VLGELAATCVPLIGIVISYRYLVDSYVIDISSAITGVSRRRSFAFDVFSRLITGLLASCFFVSAGCAGRAAQSDASAFDKIGADALATRKAPGFSFAVVRDGKVVYLRGFGQADVERNLAVGPNTRFAVGSMTKQFTAASVLLLAERGRLTLDDRLEKYLPDFPNSSDITVRMLLNQTSGLRTYPVSGEHPWPWSGPSSVNTLLAFLATDKPDFSAGAQWEYSNANYTVLSAIIAKAAGTDEAEFLSRNIFGPLLMSDSGYGYAAQQRAGVAKPYDTPRQDTVPTSLDIYAGAGAMVSTAPDIARWDIGLMERKVLSASSMQALWSAGTLANGTPVNYAMGFVPAVLAGHREVWHNGLAPGAGGYCFNAIFPDDNLAVVVLSNGYHFDGVPERMVERVLAAYYPDVAAQIAATTPPTPTPGEDAAVTLRSKDWFHRLQTGTVDLTQVTPNFAARLTPQLLSQVKARLSGAGTPTDWIYLGSQSVTGATIYRYWIRLAGVPHVWSVGLSQDGKIAGSQLQ